MAHSKLSPRKEAFCREYLIDLNATQAAIRAGYSQKTAAEQGSRLMASADVAAKIKKLMSAREARVEVQADDVLRELMRLGYSDIRGLFKADGAMKDPSDWPDDLARAIASVEVDEIYEGSGPSRKWIGYTKKVRLWNKGQSLDLLAKHKQLTSQKIEITGKLTLEDLVAGSYENNGKKAA